MYTYICTRWCCRYERERPRKSCWNITVLSYILFSRVTPTSARFYRFDFVSQSLLRQSVTARPGDRISSCLVIIRVLLHNRMRIHVRVIKTVVVSRVLLSVKFWRRVYRVDEPTGCAIVSIKCRLTVVCSTCRVSIRWDDHSQCRTRTSIG